MRKIWYVVLVWINVPYVVVMSRMISEVLSKNPYWTPMDTFMIILLTPFFWCASMFIAAIEGWLVPYFIISGTILCVTYYLYLKHKNKVKVIDIESTL